MVWCWPIKRFLLDDSNREVIVCANSANVQNNSPIFISKTCQKVGTMRKWKKNLKFSVKFCLTRFVPKNISLDSTTFRLHSIMKPERASALVSSPSKSMTKPKLLSKQWMEKRLMERFVRYKSYITVFDWLSYISLTFTGLENLLWTCPEESRTWEWVEGKVRQIKTRKNSKISRNASE